MTATNCNATGCTSQIRAYGYCRVHLKTFKATGHHGAGDPHTLAVVTLRDVQLPVGPLVTAVTTAGGIKPLLATAGLDEVSRQRLESTIRRALQRGYILAADADAVAHVVLGMHPRAVWGRRWDDTTTFSGVESGDTDAILARVFGQTA